MVSALFASCSSEEDLVQNGTDNLVRITANVSGAQTRAGFTKNSLTSFGLSISNPVSSNYTYNNVKVEKSDGVWTPAEKMLWHDMKDAVDIVACAPYSSKYGNLAGVSNLSVRVDEDQESNIDDSDFLVFKSEAFVPKRDLAADGTLDIEFEHAMCQVKIVVEFSKSSGSTLLTSNPISDFKLVGTKLNGTCDFTVKKPTVKATDSVGNIKCECGQFTAETSTTRAKACYNCIVIPQTVDAETFGVEFYVSKSKTASDIFMWTSDKAVTLEGGKSYQLDLTL